MKFTVDWLKNHLDTKFNNNQIIDKLTNIGLEVESFESSTSELDTFIVAKIINAKTCLLYTSPSPRDLSTSRMPSSA